MAKVKYKPEPGGSDETSQFGYDFKGGKAVEVDDPLHLAKFRGNRFFEVSETKAEAKKVDEAIERATPTADPTTTSELRAVHRGHGGYSIMQGAEEIREGLSKEEADKFNKLSPEDRAKQINP
jgi:preprotein translocase subunit SecF